MVPWFHPLKLWRFLQTWRWCPWNPKLSPHLKSQDIFKTHSFLTQLMLNLVASRDNFRRFLFYHNQGLIIVAQSILLRLGWCCFWMTIFQLCTSLNKVKPLMPASDVLLAWKLALHPMNIMDTSTVHLQMKNWFSPELKAAWTSVLWSGGSRHVDGAAGVGGASGGGVDHQLI